MLYPELQGLKERQRRSLRGRALRIALAYALFAALWIWGSDALLALLVDDPARLIRISSYKGIAFVAVTAGLLWALIRATYARIESGYLETQDKDRQLRASQQRHRDVLDRIIEACQIYDRQWRYLYLNPAAEIQNRRPNAELLGRRLSERWPGIEKTRSFALMQRCMTEREPFHEELEFVFPDGERGWFELNGYPVPEGIALFSIEITARKQAEAEVLRANRELEATVVERTGQLQVALARAEAADKLKSAFLATMSHELRTPLNSIIGFTGIVLQRLPGPLNDEQQRQLTMVMGSARHLLELINDVLDLSKIEAGQLSVRAETFAVAAALARMIESVRPQAERKGLTLGLEVVEAPAEIVGDRRRFEQVLLNLLSNAIKFTERGSVQLLVDGLPQWVPASASATIPSMTPEPRAAVRLRVRDTGIGIAEADLPVLFHPFRQIEGGLERHHEGTGLGLAISRRLATLMGGEIDVTSERGVGSEFTLILPQHAVVPK